MTRYAKTMSDAMRVVHEAIMYTHVALDDDG